MELEHHYQEAIRRIEATKKANTKRLSLDGLVLTKIPEEILEVKDLEVLDIRIFPFQNLELFKELKYLKRLHLTNSVINDFCFLSSLIYLEELFLSACRILDFSSIEQLPQTLKFIDLSLTPFDDYLRLSHLYQLQELVLRYTPVENYNFLEKLPQITDLQLGGNKISDISFLRNFPWIRKIGIDDNPIVNYNVLTELPKLASIFLSFNKIQDLRFMYELNNLTELYLVKTGIQEIDFLRDYNNLRVLFIGENNISNLFPIENKIHLEKLVLNRNKIQNFDLELLKFTNMERLVLSDNPIKNIPQQLFDSNMQKTNCINEVRSYQNDIYKFGGEINKSLKLVFLGNGRVGKTSLLRKLIGEGFRDEEDSTHAINIKNYNFKDMSLVLWDFGGQYIYHSTHRLFLQTESLILLLWNKEIESSKGYYEIHPDTSEIFFQPNHNIKYWLRYIQTLGKNSPTIIVQTKIDKPNNKRDVPKNYDKLSEEFKNILEYESIDSKTGKRITVFKDSIIEKAQEIISNKPPIPVPWINVLDKIKKVKKDYINYSEFEKICEDEHLERVSFPVIADYFHNSGDFFYQKGIFGTKIILNQLWAITAVYELFNPKSLFYRLTIKGNGEFSYDDIKESWKNYSRDEQILLINFMKDCKICFEKTYHMVTLEGKIWLAPSLMRDEKPKIIETYFKHDSDCLFMKYEHDYLYYGVIQSLIARAHPLSNEFDMWKNGIFIHLDSAHALIEAKYNIEDNGNEKDFIEVKIKGDDRHILINKIRNEIRRVKIGEPNELVSIDGQNYLPLNEVNKYRNEKDFTYNGKRFFVNDFNPFLVNDVNTEFSTINFRIKQENIEKMTLEQLKEKVHGFIAKAKTKEAMEAVATWAHANNREPLKSDINQLKGELVALDRQETLGLLSFQEVSREKAKLNHRLMNLMNGIDESSTKDSEGIRVDDTPTPPVTPQVNVSAKLKILMLTANPANTAILNLKKEHSLITLKLQNTQDTFNLILREAVSASEFKEFIETEQPAILHFSGHGEGGKDGGIVVQNDDKNDEELISIDGLDALFEYLKDELNIHIKAVLLNACYSEEQALTIAKYVDYVVGTTVELGDDLAIAFSTGYYFKLATSNLDFELSFKSGRTQAVMKGASKSHFVLYKNGEKSVV